MLFNMLATAILKKTENVDQRLVLKPLELLP